MGLSTEFIINRPLSGQELRKVIMADVDDMLGRDGLFTGHIAFGRVAYDVEIHVHMVNPSYPEHNLKLTAPSTVTSGGVLEGAPPLARAVDSGEGIVARTRKRTIESPNLTRIANGLPISASTTHEGQPVTRELHYEKGDFPAPSPPEDGNIVNKVADEWGKRTTHVPTSKE